MLCNAQHSCICESLVNITCKFHNNLLYHRYFHAKYPDEYLERFSPLCLIRYRARRALSIWSYLEYRPNALSLY